MECVLTMAGLIMRSSWIHYRDFVAGVDVKPSETLFVEVDAVAMKACARMCTWMSCIPASVLFL